MLHGTFLNVLTDEVLWGETFFCGEGVVRCFVAGVSPSVVLCRSSFSKIMQHQMRLHQMYSSGVKVAMATGQPQLTRSDWNCVSDGSARRTGITHVGRAARGSDDVQRLQDLVLSPVGEGLGESGRHRG